METSDYKVFASLLLTELGPWAGELTDNDETGAWFCEHFVIKHNKSFFLYNYSFNPPKKVAVVKDIVGAVEYLCEEA